MDQEDRYVWSIYLDRAMSGEERMFDSALAYCYKKVGGILDPSFI